MKACFALLVVLVVSANLWAFPNFVENPYALYPPGCATLPEQQAMLYGENSAKFFEGKITLNTSTGDTAEANLAAYRVACAEPNRSLIWLAFSIPDYVSPGTLYETPRVIADLGSDWTIGMSLLGEPGTWGGGIEPWYHAQLFGGYDDWSGETGYDKTWIFLLDNFGPSGPYTYTSGLMSPSQYNGSFKLLIDRKGAGGSAKELVLDVPSTASVISANSHIPLNGRLSGTWVVSDVPDQGFVIAISELPADIYPEPDQVADTRLVMFLSWYAYDANGAPMWLVGNSEFTMGATEVNIPIVRVSNGQLFGSKPADREQVGSARIAGNSCNDLTFEYDLGGLGLGSGSEHLQRLFSLEIAGYACRDLEARIQAK